METTRGCPSGPDIYAGNGFTPNGDGVNDECRTVSVGIREFKYLAVFNRWGKRVFYSSDPGKGWNGIDGAKPCDTGTFIWQAQGIDLNGNIVHRKGSVQLIR